MLNKKAEIPEESYSGKADYTLNSKPSYTANPKLGGTRGINRTIFPAILLIAIVIGGIFIYQDNKAITNLNNKLTETQNTVIALSNGELPIYELELAKGKQSYKAKDLILGSTYEVIRLINQATSTKATNK